MPIEIIGTVYQGNGLYGDFEYMIKSGKYENSLSSPTHVKTKPAITFFFKSLKFLLI